MTEEGQLNEPALTGYDLPIMDLDEFLEVTDAMPEREDTIEGILPAGELMLWAGDAWQGKSLEHQRLACAFGAGADYHGLRLKKCRAFYITWEGATKGIRKRFATLIPSFKAGIHPVLKMLSIPVHLNTPKGFDEMDSLITEAKENYSGIEVLLLDSFPYTCAGDYRKDQIVDAWYTNLMALCRKHELTPIVTFELRKLTLYGGKVEEYFSLDRLKGAKTIGYKSYCVLMTGEQKVQQGRSKEYVSTGHRIVVAKAKDAVAPFDTLAVSLDRNSLFYTGQVWKYSAGMERYVATPEGRASR